MDEEELTPVTKDMIDHTNVQGDVSDNKTHFVEISFDGFRLCETTTEHISLDSFNEKVLKLWKDLDAFLMESMERRRKKMKETPGHMMNKEFA
tara:strand:- start:198 stop:476 length:279 start_codon:yes stop_codon:yes gene_type:complete